MAELLVVEKLAVGYEADPDILNNINLTVSHDEIVAVVGSNGAGKSTLLKALIGLVRLRSGSIRLDSTFVEGMAPSEFVKRGMGYVPQSDNVFESLSVDENLEIGLRSRSDIALRPRREELYSSFPVLAERRRQRAGSLSGGERQILALARALMPRPRILLLDEPTAGLAPRFVERILDQIQTINRSGVAVLMMEQHTAAALNISHRGYLLCGATNEKALAIVDGATITSL